MINLSPLRPLLQVFSILFALLALSLFDQHLPRYLWVFYRSVLMRMGHTAGLYNYSSPIVCQANSPMVYVHWKRTLRIL
jgi:hypothetical protein